MPPLYESLHKDREFVSLHGAESQDCLFLCVCLHIQESCFLRLFRVLARDDPMEIANYTLYHSPATGCSRIFKKM